MKQNQFILLKYFLSFLFVSAIAGITYSQPINFEWAKGMAGKTDSDGQVDIARDPSGNIYITGEFMGTKTFGGITLFATGFREIFLAKYDSTGNCVWAIKGGANFSSAYSGGVAFSGGYVYITGSYTNTMIISGTPQISSGLNDIYLAKFDPSNGALIWFRSYGGLYINEAYSIAPTNNGGILLTGKFSDIMDFGNASVSSGIFNNIDLFFANIDANGDCIWVKKSGNPVDEDKGLFIIQEPGGDILLTGFYYGQAIFDTIQVTSIFAQDFFLARYSSSGNIKWVTTGGSPGGDWGTGIGFDTTGNIYVSGFIGVTATFGPFTIPDKGYGNLFVAGFDSNGTILWAKSAGSISNDSALDLVTDEGGSSYVTGYVTGPSDFDGLTLNGTVLKDGFVCKVAPDGTFRWVTRIGGSAFDTGKAMALDKDGKCITAGDFYNNIYIGSHLVYTTSGNYGVYLAKMGGGTVDISEPDKNYFNIYPNPVSDLLTIDFDFVYSGIFTVEVIDLNGRVCLQKMISSESGSGRSTISTTDLAPGFYYLSIDNPGGTLTRSLIISH